MTWRRLQVLVDHLPPESATKTAVRDSLTDDELAQAHTADAGHGSWSHGELLGAAQVDVLRLILHVLVLANGGKSTAPQPWPRPGVGRHRRAPQLDAAAYVARLRADHATRHGRTLDTPDPPVG